MEKLVQEFKAEVVRMVNDPDRDRRKPGKKRMEIRVTEIMKNGAEVELFYDQKFFRMFGQHDTARKEIFTGDLKTACEVARELKKMLPAFKIEFLSLEYMNSFKTEMC